MAQTVDDLRNEIRQSVGRFEREVSTAFTKESLAAICEAVGADIGGGPLPSKGEMRAKIASRVDGIETGDGVRGSFRKDELAAIASEVADS